MNIYYARTGLGIQEYSIIQALLGLVSAMQYKEYLRVVRTSRCNAIQEVGYLRVVRTSPCNAIQEVLTCC